MRTDDVGPNREVEALSRDFHLVLGVLHAFAAWSHVRHRRYRWVAFHTAVAVIDLNAARKHHRDAQ